MRTLEDGPAAVGVRVDDRCGVAPDVAGIGRQTLDELFGLLAGRFPRVESRRLARAYVTGLASTVERKNSWQLAEFAGHATPDRLQRLLASAAWDDRGVRADLAGFVVEHLGDPRSVLVVDDTGFLKKGGRSAGVQRQYSGTAGRIENCQIGCFLGYAAPAGRTLIDAELYLPECWIADPERCRAAGIPENVGFATKPELARRMIDRAMAAGVPFGWVTADEAYGDNPGLRGWLEDRRISYVVAVSCDHRVDCAPGILLRADELAGTGGLAWQPLSCGPGAKGPRVYEWALVGTARPTHRLLIRRSLADGELAFYLCHTPRGAGLAELVAVAGARWAIEECFQSAKGQVGLDHYQVRRYDAWHRHMTLAMAAHGWLTVTAVRCAAAAKGGSPQQSPTTPIQHTR